MTTSPRRGISRNWMLAGGAALLLWLSGIVGALESAPQSSTSAEKAAKKDYALIYGTVWGPDNRTVAGVPISIRRVSDKKPRWELVSDGRGEFAQRVPVGTQDYIVQANIKTPKGQPKPEVAVHIDDNERKDVGIHLNK